MVKKRKKKRNDGYFIAIVVAFISLVVLNALDDIFTDSVYLVLEESFGIIDPFIQKVIVAIAGIIILLIIYRAYLDKKIKGKFSLGKFLLRK